MSSMRVIITVVLERLGITAYRLAAITGISDQLISYWRKNNADSVKLSHLAALRRASGMSWSELGKLIDAEHPADK